MSQRASLPVLALDTIQIAEPCTEDWAAMRGTDRVRHCARCDANVYDLSALTRPEAEQLLAQAERPCLRLYRRADGTVVTRDCRAVWRSARHAAPAAAACMLALVGWFGLSSVTAFAAGCDADLPAATAEATPPGPPLMGAPAPNPPPTNPPPKKPDPNKAEPGPKNEDKGRTMGKVSLRQLPVPPPK